MLVGGAALSSGGSRRAAAGSQHNPNLDPGTPLSGRAPDFTLTDQFGKPVSLRSFRRKTVNLTAPDAPPAPAPPSAFASD
jgi:cytochrome oxidase Cu insertion factor (SCO1/SenC/PrrC family)